METVGGGDVISRAFVACVVALMIFQLTACQSSANKDNGTRVEIPFRTDGTLDILRNDQPYLKLSIEIADTDSARVRGMMQRSSFPEMSGMLFIFPNEEPRSFWMANTPLALDIIFVDSDSQIVDIHRYTRPLSPENVVSQKPARFVLEVPAGFADRFGVVESDRLRWSR